MSAAAVPEFSRPKLILASGSPQRHHLMAGAGYTFEVIVPAAEAECGVCSKESPPEYAARMAWQKAADVMPRAGQGIIIACDTVVECAGQILGKPADAEHARTMLQLLSGRVHHVYSGLCVWPQGQSRPQAAVAASTLRMDRLDDLRIDEYVHSGQWEGKAGGFGYQDRVDWLHIIDGSESNVIGLPLELLAELLVRAASEAEQSAAGSRSLRGDKKQR